MNSSGFNQSLHSSNIRFQPIPAPHQHEIPTNPSAPPNITEAPVWLRFKRDWHSNTCGVLLTQTWWTHLDSLVVWSTHRLSWLQLILSAFIPIIPILSRECFHFWHNKASFPRTAKELFHSSCLVGAATNYFIFHCWLSPYSNILRVILAAIIIRWTLKSFWFIAY